MEDLKSFEIEISDEVFSFFPELIYRTSAIKLGVAKKGLLVSRLLRRLKVLGLTDNYDYFRKVKNDTDELVEMLNCISTHTTMHFIPSAGILMQSSAATL